MPRPDRRYVLRGSDKAALWALYLAAAIMVLF